MGRNAVPARVFKRAYADGTVLYGWRPRPGAKELTRKGPGGDANLKLFCAHVLLCWNEGVDPTPPDRFLTPSETAAPPAEIVRESTAPTLRVWIGSPAKGVLGKFFVNAKSMGSDNAKAYESMFRLHGAFDILGDVPMDWVTVDHASAVCDRVLQCRSCHQRASQLVPQREVADFYLRADQPPFDKRECQSHHPARLKQRTSVERYFAKLSAAFNAAIRAKKITENPFANISYGHWEEPETNDDLRVSLTHAQMDVLSQAHPEELKVVPAVSTDGMLRRSEMWGLWASDFPVPPEDPSADPDTMTFQLSRVWSNKRFVPWGKTARSLSEPIALGATAVKALNNHLRNHMTSSPTCNACARGERIWRGDRRSNPHDECGYANNAPLVPYSRCTPDHYSKTVCPESQRAAGLGDIGFTITHRSFRSTGAVRHLDAGVPPTTVLKMGRWKDLDTLMQHYNRPTLDQFVDAARLVERTRAAELGLDQSDTAPLGGRLRYLSDENAGLTARCDALDRENAQLRAGQGLPIRVEPRSVVPVRMSKKHTGKWGAIGDDYLRSAIAAARSQSKALSALGLSVTEKNYTRLRAEARRLDIELPIPWASTPRAEAS